MHPKPQIPYNTRADTRTILHAFMAFCGLQKVVLQGGRHHRVGDVIVIDDEEVGGGGGAPLLVKVRDFARTYVNTACEQRCNGHSIQPQDFTHNTLVLALRSPRSCLG